MAGVNIFVRMEDSFRKKWQVAWQSFVFRKKLIAGFILLTIILSFFPFFFQMIEKRNGILLHDWLLNRLPVYNTSVAIFIIIWATSLMIIFRSVQDPKILMRFLWSYIFLCLLRILTIGIVALNPPTNLIPLADPISNTFYGKSYVTKDLFFSGHTASIFLIFLCLQKKIDRLIVLSGAIIAGILLLIQHVHYTVDVISAPFFAYLVYRTTISLIGKD
jgi:hypothetical protein